MIRFRNSLGLAVLVVGCVVLLSGRAAQAAHVWSENPNIAKIKGPEACAECHSDTFDIWKEMAHAKTFRKMPRSDQAREIADKMGIKRIKQEPLCLSCHFTSVQDGGKVRQVAGISCESCHGQSADWIDIHNDYGGGAVTKETEPAQHKAKRLADAEKGGMIRPERLHGWASNCYNCHTVPQEKLVNIGGHPAGSKFELVSWSQGEVRHNVWHSGGKENVKASPERKRVMYVTGQALDLAYALHGLSLATEKGEYAITMAKRAKAASLRLKKVAGAVSIPEIQKILTIADKADLKLNNKGPLSKAAEQVAASAKKFSESNDGSGLAAVDSLIPPPDKYRGSPP